MHRCSRSDPEWWYWCFSWSDARSTYYNAILHVHFISYMGTICMMSHWSVIWCSLPIHVCKLPGICKRWAHKPWAGLGVLWADHAMGCSAHKESMVFMSRRCVALWFTQIIPCEYRLPVLHSACFFDFVSTKFHRINQWQRLPFSSSPGNMWTYRKPRLRDRPAVDAICDACLLYTSPSPRD